MRPLRALACGVGGEHRGHTHVGAQRRGELSPARHRGLGGAERVEHQQPGGPPGCDVMSQSLLKCRPGGQRRHIAHPELRLGQLRDVVQHALGHAERPGSVTGRGHRHHPHPGGGRTPPRRFTSEQRERPALRNEDIVDGVVVGAGAFQPLNVPAVFEHHLLARDDRDLHVGDSLTGPAHLAVHHRQEPRRDVLRMAGARTETPRSGQPVTTVDGNALSVREELAAHRDPVRSGAEHLGEPVIGQVGRGGERRGQIGDPDPPERAVLPGHFDPCFDHLGERRFDPAGGAGIERRHQARRPHGLDDVGRQRAGTLGVGRL